MSARTGHRWDPYDKGVDRCRECGAKRVLPRRGARAIGVVTWYDGGEGTTFEEPPCTAPPKPTGPQLDALSRMRDGQADRMSWAKPMVRHALELLGLIVEQPGAEPPHAIHWRITERGEAAQRRWRPSR